MMKLERSEQPLIFSQFHSLRGFPYPMAGMILSDDQEIRERSTLKKIRQFRCRNSALLRINPINAVLLSDNDVTRPDMIHSRTTSIANAIQMSRRNSHPHILWQDGGRSSTFIIQLTLRRPTAFPCSSFVRIA